MKNTITTKQYDSITSFVYDIKEINSDMGLSGISDRKLAEKFRCKHIRSGKLSGDWVGDKDFHGMKVLACAHSSIDDAFQILTTDGRILS